MCFCAVYDHAGKVDLSKGYMLECSLHFKKIENKCHRLFCILNLFRIMVACLSLTKRGQASDFLFPKALDKNCFSHVVVNCAKIPMY